jgi:hypothetical protein
MRRLAYRIWSSKWLWLVLALVLVMGTLVIGSKAYRASLTSDPDAYRVISYKVLRGEQSHVRDEDTFIIVTRGLHSEIHAEGYGDDIKMGDILCRSYGDLFRKVDRTKSCSDNFRIEAQPGYFYNWLPITEEREKKK